jgi:predicted alpha/beta hydrolase family esterase
VEFWDWKWVVGVRDELRDAGFPTFFELFPDSIDARATYWMPFLERCVRVTEEDVLLGWSCGAVAAMRVAEKQRVRGLVLIAPYFIDHGLEVVRRAGWLANPWDWDRVRAHAGHVAVFHSDRDPYITQEEFQQLGRHLAADMHLVPGAGHFGEEETFPALTEHILRTYG